MRKLLSLLVSVAGALVVTASAAASNGGFTPVHPVSPNGHRITTAYWLVLAVTAVIFVIVEAALIVFVVRFRSRGRARTVDGPDIHGSTKLETAWTIVPVVLLAAIATFVLVELPGFTNPPARERANAVHIDVIAHQFYWEFRYANGATSYDTMVVPQNRYVELTITSEDVAHSWWIPAFGPKTDAIPGQTNHAWFKVAPAKAGEIRTFAGQCSELCGILHAKMTQHVRVLPTEQDYEDWVAGQAGVAPEQLGKQIFDASCAKCHGASAQGFVGPNLQASATPQSVATLKPIVLHGFGRMPAVGKGWQDDQIAAIVAYFKSKPFKGGTSGK